MGSADRRECPECHSMVPVYSTGTFYKHRCSGEQFSDGEETQNLFPEMQEDGTGETSVETGSGRRYFSFSVRMKTPGMFEGPNDPWHFPHFRQTEQAAQDAGYVIDGEAMYCHTSHLGPNHYELTYEVPIK